MKICMYVIYLVSAGKSTGVCAPYKNIHFSPFATVFSIIFDLLKENNILMN